MLEYIFVDFPLALIGYAGAVFAISRFVEVHDVGTSGISPAARSSTTTGEKPHQDGVSEPVLESTTETWEVAHEPEGLTTLDDEDIAIFDPMTMVEFDSQDEEPGSHVPSDVVLRRHYLANLRMMLETVHAEPTDCQLKRHHQQYLDYLCDVLVEDREAVEALETAYEARHLAFDADGE
ncbi:MAG: hypothetical protein RLZ25_1267 [Pseudomonadota bacterium]|jgi:hypothetical protein